MTVKNVPGVGWRPYLIQPIPAEVRPLFRLHPMDAEEAAIIVLLADIEPAEDDLRQVLISDVAGAVTCRLLRMMAPYKRNFHSPRRKRH